MSTATALRDRYGFHLGRIGWEDVINSTSNPFVPFMSDEPVHDPVDDWWSTSADFGSRCFPPPEDNEVEVIGATAVAKREVDLSGSIQNPELDDALSIVREFGRLNEGWNEPGSSVPGPDLIKDALVVLQNWLVSGLVPEPSVGPDGRIALELYDPEGFTLGGVEVTGGRNAIYSIIDRTEVLFTGSFDTTSQTEIIGVMSKFRHCLE